MRELKRRGLVCRTLVGSSGGGAPDAMGRGDANARRRRVEALHSGPTQLAAEERSWGGQLDHAAEASPELVPLLLVHVMDGGNGGGWLA